MAKVKLIQIISHQSSLLGLGDDGKIYRIDTQTFQVTPTEA